LLFGDDCQVSMWQSFNRRLKSEFGGDHLEELLEFLERQVAMRLLSSHETHVYPYLMSLIEELLRLFCAHHKIVFSRGKADAKTLAIRLFLFLQARPLAFFPFIPKFAEVNDFADRRAYIGRHLDEVQPLFMRNTERLGGFDDPEVSPLFVNDADVGGLYELIYAVTALDTCGFLNFYKTRQAVEMRGIEPLSGRCGDEN